MKKKKDILFKAAIVTTLVVSLLTAPNTTSKAAGLAPVNPNASQAAKNVLSYFYSITGNKIIAGQHNNFESPHQYTNQAFSISGKYPGLWGSDFGYGASGQTNMSTDRQRVVDHAKTAWLTDGDIVTLTWHEVKPNEAENAGWASVQGDYTSQQMTDLVTPGTTLYNQWLTRVDEIASYLKQLRDANVPVLWRPYHEGNGDWFWWSGKPTQYKQLWINMYNRFTNYHGLNNLIWVYGPNANNQWAGPLADYYPGSQYVDMLAQDIYDGDYSQSYYDEITALAQGKPVGIGENGEFPNISTLKSSQPKYSYFMTWGGGYLTAKNSNATITNTYNDAFVLTRDKFDVPTANSNILLNPNFDSGSLGSYWGAYGTSPGVVRNDGNYRSASYSFNMYSASAYNSNLISNEYTVNSGTYTAQVYAKSGGTWTTAQLEVYKNGTLVSTKPITTSGSFTSFAINNIFAANNDKIKVSVWVNAGAGAWFYFDDFSLTKN
ncbi:hypothetical protein C8Z91_03820 [Paenibacillus elgii]|uniref:GH26 domain-containing protein n=1 Tax=Paenibacillus elgii TaxID=189691 RepID=A0A2T6G8V8_9BACL|nr:glycosyl hydrolase [Paenibacillus elgii]PUA40597.1 hypothetical protein C8Z91_03820 [Paenibacillus elgii]